MSEAQPETVAGRRLLDYLNAKRPLSRNETQLGYGFGTGTARSDPMLADILAIEAEAARTADDRHVAALADSLHAMLCATHIDSTGCRFNHRLEAQKMLALLPVPDRPPVPNPEPGMAYAPDGSIVGAVIGWGVGSSGQTVPVILPVPDRPVELDVAALDLIRRFPSPDGATWWNEERLAFLARLAEAPDGR